MFVTDGFGFFMKSLILIGSAMSIVLAMKYNEREGIDRFEFPVLILLATAGMLMMVSANDLISLYVGLELQSLALYVVAAFRRDSVRSTEAGLKYFVLGALSSGMLLYGASMIYGFAGTTAFDQLGQVLATPGVSDSIGLIVGIVFVSVGLAFKCSAVPFHMWTPDVYEGAPTPVTAFFAVAPKIAALALFVRVMIGPFGHLMVDWRQIIQFIAVCSMILGSLAAINQQNIKRLMAYSSIGHVGYALVGLAAGTATGIQGLMIYMAIYLFMNLGTFAVILSMRRDGDMVEGIADLAGLSKTRPMMAAALAVMMFSMAGIPPLGGFWSKWFVFLAAIDQHLYALAIIGVVTSVIGAFYYLRIIKLMYFDEATVAFEAPVTEVGVIVFLGTLGTVYLGIFPSSIVAAAHTAAATLFPG
jgi:NADH-quinone oxidoreductase subunit N